MLDKFDIEEIAALYRRKAAEELGIPLEFVDEQISTDLAKALQQLLALSDSPSQQAHNAARLPANSC